MSSSNIDSVVNDDLEARNLAAAVKSLQVAPMKTTQEETENKVISPDEETMPTETTTTAKVPLPFVLDRVLLFDLEDIKYLRSNHNMAGTLIGTLPQIPQQNIFLGLPVELMPEESLYLLSRDIGYIVDDRAVHQRVQTKITKLDREQILKDREAKKEEMVQVYLDGIKRKRHDALLKKGFTQAEIDERDQKENNKTEGENITISDKKTTTNSGGVGGGAYSLDSAITYSTPATSSGHIPYYAAESSYETLVNSGDDQKGDNDLLKSRAIKAILSQTTPAAFATYAYLNDRGYFVSPGLRFGCQFLAYPGDSLRFHSHFMVIGLEYEEEFDILSMVVGGGRLGGAVKKGMMIGGLKSKKKKLLSEETSEEDNNDWVDCEGEVVTYCVEWAGFG